MNERGAGAGVGFASARYRQSTPKSQAERVPRRWRGLAGVAAPLLSSRAVFPIWLAYTTRRMRKAPGSRPVPFKHAERYFGRRLVIRVDPATLRFQLWRHVEDEERRTSLIARFLDGGDWTELLEAIETTGTSQDMSQLVEYGAAFREMPAYENFLRSAAVGRPMRRKNKALADRASIDAYFEHYLDLAESFRAGVVRHEEAALLRGAAPPASRAWLAGSEHLERNPAVAITADGQLVRLNGGRHRTAIAQALGLPAMWVEVHLVHVNWLAREMEETGLPAHQALLAWLAKVSSNSV